jgi:hypothetical protein
MAPMAQLTGPLLIHETGLYGEDHKKRSKDFCHTFLILLGAWNLRLNYMQDLQKPASLHNEVCELVVVRALSLSGLCSDSAFTV